jgi:hypothetical protein
MIWIKHIWIMKQSKNIISPPNKDKLLITIIQIALKQYPGFNQSQTTMGTRWILEMEMVMMLVLMERPPHMPRRIADDDGVDFPPHRRLRCCRICPLPELERTFASATVSANLGKSMA